MKETGLIHDEGPDKDGGVGPYVQSERHASGLYLKYAKQLIEQGDAYYCFCDKERLESLEKSVSEGKEILYMTSIVCILSKEEVQKRILQQDTACYPFQMPTEGTQLSMMRFTEISLCLMRNWMI